MTSSASTAGPAPVGDLGHAACARGDSCVDRSIRHRFAVADVHGVLDPYLGACGRLRDMGNPRCDEVGRHGQRNRPCDGKAEAHADDFGPVCRPVVDEAHPVDPAQAGTAGNAA